MVSLWNNESDDSKRTAVMGLLPIMSMVITLSSYCMTPVSAFSVTPPSVGRSIVSTQHVSSSSSTSSTSRYMSFVADGSDYSSSESDYEDTNEDDMTDSSKSISGFNPLAMDAPTMEEEPVPFSKNADSRFLAIVWDNVVDTHGRDRAALHEHRVSLTTDHVMFCRKTNLYNETFNYNSNADIIWSYPLLASDVKSYIGHALCIDSNTLEDAKEVLRNDPIIQSLTDDISNVSFFRWRHIKDHMLRQDSGRFGMPTLIVSMHDADDETLTLRDENYDDHLKYLIKTERVIQAGPLYSCTKDKNDKKSVPMGDICIMNARDRAHAIEFAENDPLSQVGLYSNIKVHRFNDLDVTGKFVSENQFYEDGFKDLGMEMKEALDYWGYPVDDTQTRWINR